MLVNFVLDYPFEHFISYTYYVRQEMTKRNYRTMDRVWNKIVSLEPDGDILPIEQIYSGKMNKFYFQVCLWNLMEKVDCGGITEEPYRSMIIDEFNDTKTYIRI